MSFWRKVFNRAGKGSNIVESSDGGLGSISIEDLEKLIVPLIRAATKIEVQSASMPPKNAHLLSHFGGQPYFEKGEKWPMTRSGRNMQFIFQVFNEEGLELPQEIKLIQFFYDWEEFPWDTTDDGWLVKIYKELDVKNIVNIPRPAELDESKYCAIKFKPIKALPDWEGIDAACDKASAVSCALNSEEPWDAYENAVKRLVGEEDYLSQLGGYPKWVQGESTPKNKNGEHMKLLFQIDSEENAELMWGDVGLVYVFYDEKSGETAFNLQCH